MFRLDNYCTAIENTNTIKVIALGVQLLNNLKQRLIEMDQQNRLSGELILECFSQQLKDMQEVNIDKN